MQFIMLVLYSLMAVSLLLLCLLLLPVVPGELTVAVGSGCLAAFISFLPVWYSTGVAGVYSGVGGCLCGAILRVRLDVAVVVHIKCNFGRPGFCVVWSWFCVMYLAHGVVLGHVAGGLVMLVGGV